MSSSSKAFRSAISLGGDRKGKAVGDTTPRVLSCSTTCAMLMRWISGVVVVSSAQKASSVNSR